MGDILIIGGGFAGLEAARFLSKKSAKLNGRRILLIDSSPSFVFSPLLPALISGRVSETSISFDRCGYLRRLNVNFQLGEVAHVNTGNKEVKLKDGTVLSFEFLLLCCGTEPGFTGSRRTGNQFKPGCLEEALLLKDKVSSRGKKKIIVIGGGIRGVETANALAALLKTGRPKKFSINLIEKEEDILPSFPVWAKDYCRASLSLSRVNIFTESEAKEDGSKGFRLSNGMVFDDPLVVWACGSEAPSFVREMDVKKDERGFIRVDERMMFEDSCFAAGTVASFKNKAGDFQESRFSSAGSARIAAKNVLSIISGGKINKYTGPDRGFFILLSGAKACGRLFFFNVTGVIAYMIYVLACIVRTYSFKTKLGIFLDMFFNLRFARS